LATRQRGSFTLTVQGDVGGYASHVILVDLSYAQELSNVGYQSRNVCREGFVLTDPQMLSLPPEHAADKFGADDLCKLFWRSLGVPLNPSALANE